MTSIESMQTDLFSDAEAAAAIPGLRYEQDFLTHEEEMHLIEVFKTLPLHAARYKQYEARRQVMSFGGTYDFTANKLLPGAPLDARLKPLRDRVAEWMGISASRLVQVLVAYYAPGTPLGWHRDVPDYEAIAGVSFSDEAVLKFRPYPPTDNAARHNLQLEVAPRSIYLLSGPARWAWQHCVPPVKAPRWSITFRTPRLATKPPVRSSVHVSASPDTTPG